MAQQRQNHSQLKRPLVIEALMELRFTSQLSYGLVPGRLFETLKDTFPLSEELPIAQFPVDVSPINAVRHRFLSADKGRLFQIGVGVVTVNHVHYTNFNNFKDDCTKVLAAINNIGLVNQISRMGLRYINFAPLDRSWSDITCINVKAPDVLQVTAFGQEFKWHTRFFPAGILSTTIAWPVDNNGTPSMAIDLDHSREDQQPFVSDKVINWLDAAHENIYTVFTSVLTPSFYKELRGD